MNSDLKHITGPIYFFTLFTVDQSTLLVLHLDSLEMPGDQTLVQRLKCKKKPVQLLNL